MPEISSTSLDASPGLIVDSPPPPAKPTNRLLSLDAMRGATIALMVMVNNAGGPASYRPLNHSAWDGWTITDMVFPTFLWIVGVAITLSLGKRIQSGVPRSKLMGQIFRRALVLYVLGLLVYVAPAFSLSTQRLLGVLQRIAICYLIASLIYLYASIRVQIGAILALYAVYWILMMYVPVPGYGAGHLDIPGNFAHYVDRVVLGAHNYQETATWDPEGIISTIPAIGTALLGIMAGHLLRLRQTLAERVCWLFLTGSLVLTAGLILDIFMPINKKLWSDAFSLFMGGFDFILLAIFAWTIDGPLAGVRIQRLVKPLLIMGMNAIAVYLASEWGAEIIDMIHVSGPSPSGRISLQQWIYLHIFAPLASPMNASLLYSIAFMLTMYAIAYFLYRRNWLIRV